MALPEYGEDECTAIGGVCNYYGSLSVAEDNGKFYWSIENWDGHDWEAIPEALYLELVKYNEAYHGD